MMAAQTRFVRSGAIAWLPGRFGAGSVGAYRIEGRGAQLFERIEGDHFAILGLPLIELLGFLRGRGLVGE